MTLQRPVRAAENLPDAQSELQVLDSYDYEKAPEDEKSSESVEFLEHEDAEIAVNQISGAMCVNSVDSNPENTFPDLS